MGLAISSVDHTKTFMFLGVSTLVNFKRVCVGQTGSSMDYFLSSLLFTQAPHSPIHPLCVFQKKSAASIFHLCFVPHVYIWLARSLAAPRHLFLRLNSKPFLNPLVTTFVAGRPNCELGRLQTEVRKCGLPSRRLLALHFICISQILENVSLDL